MISFLKGSWDLVMGFFAWVGSMLSGFGRWLRKERSAAEKWRLVCFSLAAVCLWFAFAAQSNRYKVIVLQGECALAAQQCDAAKTQLINTAAGRQHALDDIAKSLDATAKEIERIQAENAKLKDENTVLRRGSIDRFNSFMQQYNAKPAECTAALAVLEQACPQLKGY